MHVCMYVCMSVCLYVCMYVCMYVCYMYVYIIYIYISWRLFLPAMPTPTGVARTSPPGSASEPTSDGSRHVACRHSGDRGTSCGKNNVILAWLQNRLLHMVMIVCIHLPRNETPFGREGSLLVLRMAHSDVHRARCLSRTAALLWARCPPSSSS